MDIVVLVMAIPPTHSLDPQKEAGRWKLGDIVDVVAEAPETPAPGSRLGFIRIRNTPYATIEEAREAIVLVYRDLDDTLLGRSLWKVDAADVPTSGTRDITVNWNQIKSRIKRLSDGATIG